MASNLNPANRFGAIKLDISNSVIPLDRLTPTPSSKDGLDDESESQIRSLGCDLIQIAGKLLKLPQVAMATGCVLFHRFFFAKSLIRNPFDVVAMAALGLACKIEESPRRPRDIINVFRHIKQIRSGQPIVPVVLDANYIALKNAVIKAERRILKELGFCVHVKHPHKIIVMYLKWLEQDTNQELTQMSWNFMNDSLRTDVFVRHPPETIAVACIYLSARKLQVPLPQSPSWFDVLGVEEDDIKDCCYRMICLYNRQKPNQSELEALVESLRKKLDESRRAARDQSQQQSAQQSQATSAAGTPVTSANPSPVNNGSNQQQQANKENGSSMAPSSQPMSGANPMDGGRRSNNYYSNRSRSRSPSYYGKKHRKSSRHRRSRSRSRSVDSYERRSRKGDRGSHHHRDHRKRDYSRSPSYTPPKKSRKAPHKDKRGSYGSKKYDKYSRSGKEQYYRR